MELLKLIWLESLDQEHRKAHVDLLGSHSVLRPTSLGLSVFTYDRPMVEQTISCVAITRLNISRCPAFPGSSFGKTSRGNMNHMLIFFRESGPS